MRLSPTDVTDLVGGEHVEPVGRRSRRNKTGTSSRTPLPQFVEEGLARIADQLPQGRSVDHSPRDPWAGRIHTLDRLLGMGVGSFIVFAVLTILI
jgi:hypothetical protein